jgi:hypothetical protein
VAKINKSLFYVFIVDVYGEEDRKREGLPPSEVLNTRH